MDLKDIEMNANGSKFDFFLTYNVLVGSGHWKSFHTHVASIALDSDIFQDRRYAVTFDSHNRKIWCRWLTTPKKYTYRLIHSVSRSLGFCINIKETFLSAEVRRRCSHHTDARCFDKAAVFWYHFNWIAFWRCKYFSDYCLANVW